MSMQATLSAATNDRKARLAQLKSLKRKQAPPTQDAEEQRDVSMDGGEDLETSGAINSSLKRSRSPSVDETPAYLSGRNYDASTRGPKLGFENTPSAGMSTIELQAQALAAETKRLQEAEEAEDKPLDLFKLQPKKPNWDLKRDLEKKLEVLNVRTDNAIARLVRERVTKAQMAAKTTTNGAGVGGGGGGDGEAMGMEGSTLVEAMHMREKEAQDDERRKVDENDEVEV